MSRLISLLVVTITFAGGLVGFSEELPTPEQRIDALIESGLAAQGLKPNDPIDDVTFLRRAWLSIAGRIPTIEEAEAFHGSQYENKRERLIEELLSSDAYVSHFYNFWADILRMQDDGPSRNAFLNYQLWLKKALRENLPYDQFVYEMVSSRGKSWENGATGYYHRDRGMPLDNMSNTVRIFLGTRLECAQCHNHPFDEWTQMDYFKMAAFSYGMNASDIYTYAPHRINAGEGFKARTKRIYLDAVGKGDGFPIVRLDRLEEHIAKHSQNDRDPWLAGKDPLSADEFRALVKKGWEAADEADKTQEGAYWAGVAMYKPLLRYAVVQNEKELQLPHDYQYDDAKPLEVIAANTMFGDEIDLAALPEGQTPIDAYATWMTSPKNPRFTRVIANRLWKKAFGIGLIEPVDEYTAQTEPSIPELMAYLETLMVDLDYDMRAYLKVLFNTRAWQRSASQEEVLRGVPYHFAGPPLQRMSAEQIWDSFVALCIPEAERYRPLLKSQLSSVEKERLMWESLEGRDFDDYVKMMETLAPLVYRQRQETERLSFAMTEAKVAGKEDDYQRLRQELKAIDAEVNKAVEEIGYIELYRARKGDQLLGDMLGLSEQKMTAMGTPVTAKAKEGASDSAMTMMGGQSGASVFTALPTIELPPVPAGLTPQQTRDWEKQQRRELGVFKKLVSKMARASELEMPAPRGHFLRDFGQSDREVIENASAEANVPQALNLLNGEMIDALTNPFAVFGRRLEAAESPDDKARIIFQAMLTREPTDRELELAQAEFARSGEDGYRGLVWALLNTQQFMFVQ
ncbi:MAG: DUF1549 domain-containing protein [Verrucomicrobiae bacterium]|nr:DUF1549 domain-containing protein [Verrucomicrobiae bacterium]